MPGIKEVIDSIMPMIKDIKGFLIDIGGSLKNKYINNIIIDEGITILELLFKTIVLVSKPIKKHIVYK